MPITLRSVLSLVKAFQSMMPSEDYGKLPAATLLTAAILDVDMRVQEYPRSSKETYWKVQAGTRAIPRINQKSVKDVLNRC